MARPVTPSRSKTRPSRAAPRRVAAVAVVVAGLAVLGAGLAGAFGAPGPSSPPGLVAAASTLPSGFPSGALPAPSLTSGASSPGEGSGSPAASIAASGAPSATPVATGPAAAADARRALELHLQATLDRVRTKLAIPGASVTVLFPDGTSWSGASGLAVVAARTPVTPRTAFAFASMSKTFTSALVLELVGEGKLALGDSAATLLPAGLPLKVDRRITVGMLLDHTSGLADFFLNPKIDRALQRDPTRTWTPLDALKFVGAPLSAPGKAWHYSNTNYLLLGLIAERITGKPLAVSIRERFLDKLGLQSTWFQAVETDRAALADGYRVTSTKPGARPVDLADGSGVAPFRSVVTAAGGAGSLAGTSSDIAHWARALYGGEVLGPVGTGLLLSDFTRTTNYIPGVSYGFGVQTLTIDGHRSLGHSGKLLGFRGAVRHFPAEGLTIAVLTNQSRADPAVLLRSILKVASPPATPASPASPPPGGSAAPAPSASAGG